MNGNGKNIVLDIDATLVHTHGDMDDFKMLNVYGNDEQLEMRRKVYNMRIIDVSDVPGEGEVTDLAGIYRPYLREFLEFGFSYFDNIVIWSAGKKKYVEKMCEYMFPLKKQPIRPMIIPIISGRVNKSPEEFTSPIIFLQISTPTSPPNNPPIIDLS